MFPSSPVFSGREDRVEWGERRRGNQEIGPHSQTRVSQTQRPALSTQYSVLSTQPPAPRSALRAPHSALAIVRPFAGKGSKVTACCESARHGGVRIGMPQAEALATLPGLAIVEEDAAADRAALEKLAEWTHRYTPYVALEEGEFPSSLLADITGFAACFGGEESLLRQVGEEFNELGWTVHLAIANTPGAAWALAHQAEEVRNEELRTNNEELGTGKFHSRFSVVRSSLPGSPQVSHWFFIVPPADHERILGRLPVDSLRLPEQTVALLRKLGIQRIGQLAALPRTEVAQRFGPGPGIRLDRALGRVPDIIVPYRTCIEASADSSFEHPLEHLEAIAQALDELLTRLEIMLERRQHGVRLLECVLEQERAAPIRFECRVARPNRSAAYWGKLLRTRLETIQADAPIQGVRLRAAITERVAPRQRDLFAGRDATDDAAFVELLDQLASRLGPEAVTMARFVPDPQPELACRFEPALDLLTDDKETGDPSPRQREVFRYRPLLLYPEPVAIEVVAVADGQPSRFRRSGEEHTVRRSRGPERIEVGWWRGPDVQRDYFAVETTAGTRWWLFRRRDTGRWFLHGCFD